MSNGSRRGTPAAMMSGVLALALCAGQATAQVDASWLSDVSGAWSQGSFWSGGMAPLVPGDRATIDATGDDYTVTLDISVSLSGFNLTSSAATLQGSAGSTMTVVDTLFANASLVGLTGYTSTGRLTFAGDVCDDLTDTPLEHTGSIAEWIGTGDILLGDNAQFTNGEASTFNIENASRMFWDGAGTRSRFINDGKISKNSPGLTTIEGVAFTNNGSVCVFDGELEFINVGLVGLSLDMGNWEVGQDSTLSIAGAQYQSLDASVVLDGPNSSFEAIDSISQIGNGGSLEIRNGRDFTTRGNLIVAGSLTIGQPQLASSTMTVSGNLGNIGSVHLGGGFLSVAGTHLIAADGVFSGNGVQDGDMVNDGLVSPGDDTEAPNSPGELTIRDGVYEQGENGRILIEIAGRQPGAEYDVFRANRALFDPTGDLMAGTLEIALIDGFVPEMGDTFDVFQFGSREGEFEAIDGLMQRGITFRATFTEDALRVEVVAIPAPGSLAALGLVAGVGALRRRRRA